MDPRKPFPELDTAEHAAARRSSLKAAILRRAHEGQLRALLIGLVSITLLLACARLAVGTPRGGLLLVALVGAAAGLGGSIVGHVLWESASEERRHAGHLCEVTFVVVTSGAGFVDARLWNGQIQRFQVFHENPRMAPPFLPGTLRVGVWNAGVPSALWFP